MVWEQPVRVMVDAEVEEHTDAEDEAATLHIISNEEDCQDLLSLYEDFKLDISANENV